MSELSRKLYLFKDENFTAIFTDELMDDYPSLASGWIADRVHARANFLLKENSLLFDIHKKFSREEIGWVYRKRFGRVLRTSIVRNEAGLAFTRELVGGESSFESSYLIFDVEKLRSYKEGKILSDILANVLDDESQLELEMKNFAAQAFISFQGKGKSNLLSEKCLDVAPANCLISSDGAYEFFDFEFRMKGGG